MRIWLIQIGEPLPIDGSNERLYRMGIIANLLIKKGHKVIWWSSTFNHVRKKQRFNKDTSININNHFNIRLLYSLKYKNNVSIERIINHHILAHKFSKLAELEVQPDIILCSYPTIELSLVATKYGKRKNVPVIIDVRDLWPDNFLDMVPMWGRWLAKIILIPMLKKTRVIYKSATGIVGLTSDFVEWGINYANRKHSNLDREFPMGYIRTPPNQKAIIKAKKFWDSYGINQKNNEFIVCFFGTMGHQFDLKTIIKTAQKLMFQKTLFRFVLCGNGDNLMFYKNIAKNCKNVFFPGWIGTAEIWTLMRLSHVGLVPYVNSKNFTLNLPNKPIEYLSAGLPIVSSLKEGVLADLLKNYNCGMTYNNANDLTSKLIDLFNNPEILKEMSKNAFDLYKEKFVAEEVYNDMIDYLELVAKNYKKN